MPGARRAAVGDTLTVDRCADRHRFALLPSKARLRIAQGHTDQQHLELNQKCIRI